MGAVNYEAEVAVIIGKDAYHVSRHNALEHIMGFTVGLDMTHRERQTAAKDKGHPCYEALYLLSKKTRGTHVIMKHLVSWSLSFLVLVSHLYLLECIRYKWK